PEEDSPVEEEFEVSYKEEVVPVAEPVKQPEKPKKPKYDNYKIPYKKLFSVSDASLEEMPAWLEEKKEIINQQLQAFGIDGEVITYTKGPAFTRYEIMLAQNVNVKKINGIYDNIQMALKAKSMRIQAPIPGKNTVGIEVPNEKADMVAYGDILTDEYIGSNKNLLIAMGKDIDGTPVFQNIIDMPHALIAGATKSGKSVCINTLLVSLLIKNSPEQLKLILVDPKKVELSFYNNLPHLATPVIDDPVIATEALKWAVVEMERRYELLALSRVRNIEDYNRKREMKPEMESLPFIVIVVDEFNDLIMQCGVEANDAIVRLAQKARAAGIHIILATQRPTVNVVSGTIKANITCRIAF
ncbi:MAG: DNA translocase FtsK, partial [Anaeroplasmataceae bacterium]|nr:DNA translocase FtsK [Anaeroplasmataceae bacterium]